MTRLFCISTWLVIAVVVAGWPQLALSQDKEPDALSAPEILKRMVDTYATCDTYSDSGTVETVYHLEGGEKEKVEKQFSTAMIRPDRFRFEYTDSERPKSRYLIWRKGDDVRTWWDVTKKNERPKTLSLALAGATGVSGGSAHKIPALMMPNEIGGRTLKNLKRPKLDDEQKLDDKDCFVIDAQFANQPIKIWIDKTRLLVLRIDQTSTYDDFSTVETTLYEPKVNEDVDEDQLIFDPPK